jgi:hypothetical protein
MSQNNKAIEKHLKLIELLLAESLLQGQPKPNVHALEKFIGVRKGTLAKLQSQDSDVKKGKNPSRDGGEVENAEED